MRKQRTGRVITEYVIKTVFVCLSLSVMLGCVLETASAELTPELIQASKLLRPKPDDEYDYQPVLLTEDPHRKPEINVEALLKTLGDDFQPRFMSVFNPNETQKETDHVPPKTRHKKKNQHTSTRETLKSLLGGRMTYVPKGQPEFRHVLKKFLRSHTQCRVSRYWYDAGEHWFPRYVRQAVCTPTNSSCSIPPGMTCLPHKYKELRMLLWSCTSGIFSKKSHVGQPAVNVERQRCRWMKRYYQVLDECTCKCNS